MSEGKKSKNWIFVSALIVLSLALIVSVLVMINTISVAKAKIDAMKSAYSGQPPSVTAGVIESTAVPDGTLSVEVTSSDQSLPIPDEVSTTNIDESVPVVSVLRETVSVHWSEGNSMEDPCLVEFEGKTKFCVQPYNGLTYDEEERPLNGNIHVYLEGDGCTTFETCFELLTNPVDCSIFYTNLMWLADELVHAPAYNDGVPGIPPGIPIDFWSASGENLQVSIAEDCRVTTTQL